MTKEELTNKLVRLGNMMNEAWEIVEEMKNEVNGRVVANCPDISIVEILPHSTARRRFVNAARREGVYRLKDLLLYTPSEVMMWRNVGKRCIADIQEDLQKRFGIKWEE